MLIDLSKVEFTYDFFSASMPDGNLLVLNKVSEDFLVEGEEITIKRINIVVQPVNGENNLLCSSVIGIGNDYLMLKSDYTEQLGKVLTEDNMKYCMLELYE